MALGSSNNSMAYSIFLYHQTRDPEAYHLAPSHKTSETQSQVLELIQGILTEYT